MQILGSDRSVKALPFPTHSKGMRISLPMVDRRKWLAFSTTALRQPAPAAGSTRRLRVAQLHGCRARGRIHVVGGDWCTDGPRAHAIAYAGEHSALGARPDTEGSGEPSAAHMDDEGAQTVTSVAEQRLALALEAAELGTWTWDM